MFDSFPLVLSFLSRTSTNVWGVVNHANRFLGFNQYSRELICLAQGHNTSGDRSKPDLSNSNKKCASLVFYVFIHGRNKTNNHNGQSFILLMLRHRNAKL